MTDTTFSDSYIATDAALEAMIGIVEGASGMQVDGDQVAIDGYKGK